MTPDTLHDYNYAVARIKALEKVWTQEIGRTEERRDLRYVRRDLKEMRALGMIPQDGVYVPRRIAHNNIKREQAPIVAYFTQAKDTAKFRALDNLGLPPDPLNSEFTRFSQHEHYLKPYLETWDGACTHGWDAMETLLDADAPGHFRNQHIGHENLWFAWDSTNIQYAPLVIVVYPITAVQLGDYEDQFAPGPFAEVQDKLEHLQDKDTIRVRLMKVFFKDPTNSNVVNVAFYCEWASDWLLAPQPFELGKGDQQGPQFEYEYPIEILRYSISEDEVITSSVGRVFEDEPDQEACTQLTTAYVNRAIRSQYLMFSPTDQSDDTSEREQKVAIGDGIMLKRPAQEFHLEPADINVLNAMNTLTNQNANESGQTNFAIQNRKDSRKTATENVLANQQGALLSSVQVVMLSQFAKGVMNRDWLITKSQVLQGKLSSLLPNWQVYYNRDYTILPAGDVDVIKRQETLMAMKQDWPVIQTTGAKQPFLEDMLRLSPYAENADKYIRAMEAENWKDNLIKGMGQALQTITLDPKTGQLQPYAQPYAKQLQEIQGEYQQVMTPPGQQPQGQGEQPPAEAPPEGPPQ